MTIIPAAGPLIVRGALPNQVARSPPMAAVIIPAMGGTPLASPIPKAILDPLLRLDEAA